MINISSPQRDVIQLPINEKIFLEGPAGTGKTTVGVERMLHLMNSGIPGSTILIYLPQRILAVPYVEAMNTPGVVAGGMPRIFTLAGLSQYLVELFWPAIAKVVGFANPSSTPVFLNFETAQYYMRRIVQPLLTEGLFESVTMDRNRIYAQILDNLNKAAIVGFPFIEIGDRLKTAWTGKPGQSRVYDDAQTSAALFREYCLQHNLLDYSLVVEIFNNHLWKSHIVNEYLKKSFQHIIIDNIEEDVPVSHDMLAKWLPETQSSLVIYDSQAGYRSLLGADPLGAYRLKEEATSAISFEKSYVMSPEVQSLASYMNHAFLEDPTPMPLVDPRPAISLESHTYYTEMLEWVTNQIESLIFDEGVSPKDIVVLAPILSDSLRFSIVNRLQSMDIPVKTHRPSRSLRDEPATMCLISLISLAHPELGLIPTQKDLTQCLMLAIGGMDLIRSKILTDVILQGDNELPRLIPFDQLDIPLQDRISYELGEKYDHLRLWLDEYRQSEPVGLDYFVSRIFGEVLSQPGYGFHTNVDASKVVATIVESIRNFRRVLTSELSEGGLNISKEYLQVLQDGLVASQYLFNWQSQEADAVLIAPATTFLINNYPVDIQFWLDIGNQLWAERLYQPISNPYVLSRNWSEDETWTFVQEMEIREQRLRDLVFGLLTRCRQKVYLGMSEYNEQGYEQRGPLLQAVSNIFQTVTNK